MFFTISKGKFVGEYISFIPPEGFMFDICRDECKRHINFFSIDCSIDINIVLEKETTKGADGLVDYLTENDLYMLGEPRNLKRGNGSAFGVYYGETDKSAIGYKEVHDFYRTNGLLETKVSVEIRANSWRRIFSNPIYQVLGFPEIKTFLDSIEYYK